MTAEDRLILGLIGDNIAQSRAPLLHRLAGRQSGIEVRYDRLVPRARDQDFRTVFDSCAPEGYRGVNITYPYKEVAAKMVRIEDPLVRAMGAVNTVLFEPGGPVGHNTDFTGFQSAYRAVRGETPPGSVLIIGCGGVGRAVAFALVGLGATRIRLVDRDSAQAASLAEAIRAVSGDAGVILAEVPEAAAHGVDGVINCTPVGMVGHGGTPIDAVALAGAQWAFDAVYTPSDTQFLGDAARHGLSVVSGWELFFWQGVHAWKEFSGTPLDEAALREALLTTTETA
ncbi:shikimate dehydrogenase [Sulfitobacter sp. LCG007]